MKQITLNVRRYSEEKPELEKKCCIWITRNDDFGTEFISEMSLWSDEKGSYFWCDDTGVIDPFEANEMDEWCYQSEITEAVKDET